MSIKNTKITNKQLKFVTEYLKDFNATQAAIRTGYSKNGAEVQGSRLLSNVNVQQEVQKIQDEAANEALVTTKYIVEGLKEVAERCLTRKAVMVFDRAEKGYIQKTEECKDQTTGEITEEGVWEFDSMGANKALELLGKYKNIFKESEKENGKVTVELVNFAPKGSWNGKKGKDSA